MGNDNESFEKIVYKIQIEGDLWDVEDIKGLESTFSCDHESESGVVFILSVNLKVQPYYKQYKFYTEEKRDEKRTEIIEKLRDIGIVVI